MPIVGGRVPQERIDYMVEKLITVRTLTNQIMSILNPFFQIPVRIRDAEQHLTSQQRGVIDRSDAIINSRSR